MLNPHLDQTFLGKGQFIPLKGNCPICDGTSRKCSRHEPTDNVHCRGRVANPPSNYEWIGTSSIGFDIFKLVGGAADNSRYSQRQEQEQGRTPIEPLSIELRDRQYRSIARRRGLSTKDRAELKRRGLTDNEIDELHRRGIFFTWDGGPFDRVSANLPGAAGVNRLREFKGLAIAVPNLDYAIAGCQIRPYKPLTDGGKYYWASSKNQGGAASNLPNGELPIGVYHPIGKPLGENLWFAEGLLKPQISTLRLQEICVGAAGANFASSPEQVKVILEAFPKLPLVLAADGGAVSNPDVMAAYSRFNDLVVKLGRSLQVGWWGQFTKQDGDIDEIGDLSRIELISWDEFVEIADKQGGFDRSKRQLLWRLEQIYQNATSFKQKKKVRHSKRQNPLNKQADVLYENKHRLETWQEGREKFQFALDSSPPGTGKSFTAGSVEPADFGVGQIIYATSQQRNPTTETLTKENGWPALEARHDGLVREATVNGSSRLRRRKKGEEYDVAPNCNRTELINALRAKNVSGADTAAIVCGGCPLKEACAHAEGRGYGFLYQRKNAIPAPKLRAHPDSLPSPSDYDYSNTAIIWDEAGQNLKFLQEIRVRQKEVEQVIGKIAIASPELFTLLEPLFSKLLELFEEKQGRHGLSFGELLTTLPALPDELSILAIEQILQPDLSFLNPTQQYEVDLADLPPAIRRRFADRDSDAAKQAAESVQKQWLGQLLQILSGQQRGYVSLSNRKASRKQSDHNNAGNRLSIWYADPRHVEIAKAAAYNVFLDATLDCEQLALVLGCDSSEIFVCSQQTEPPKNLRIIQATGLGRMGMQRGGDQQKRADAITDHYRKLDPTTKVIDFKKFDEDGAWWRDSRGVNDFLETGTLILIGTPCPNLASLAAQFAVLTGLVPGIDKDQKLPDCFFNWLIQFPDLFSDFSDQWALKEIDAAFNDFVDALILAEFVQAIGRLRANRRCSEQLRIVIVSDFDLTGIGYPIQQIDAGEICPDAAPKSERQERAIKAAVDQIQAAGQKVTQVAVSAITGIKQSYLSRRFRKLLLLLVSGFNSESNNLGCQDLVPVIEAAISDSTTLEQVIEVTQEALIDWGGGASLFNQLNHATRSTILAALIAISFPSERIGMA